MHVTFVFHAEFLRHWVYGERPIARGIKEINLLQKHGHSISVVCWVKEKRTLPNEEVWNDIEIHRVFLVPPKKSPLKRFLAYRLVTREMMERIVKLRPDAIVCHDLEMLGASVKAKKRLKVPLFYDAHEDYPAMVYEDSKLEALYFNLLEKILIRHVDHTYTVCEPIAAKFKRMKSPITVLYNSRPITGAPEKDDSVSKKKRQEVGFAEKDFVLGFVGNLTRHSNLEILIELLIKLPEDIKLMLIGGPKERIEELRSHARDLNLEERVHFQGLVPYDELLDYIAVFDVGMIVLSPAGRNYLMRSPNKLFEYMAVGIPQIVSDFPNMRKIVVEECRSGMAVDPLNDQAIVGAIKTLYENPEKRMEMGRNARACSEGVYCWERQEEKLAGSHPVFGS